MKWAWFNLSRLLISNSMKRKLLLGLGLMMGWCLKAQVAMTVLLPPVGLTVKPQLWDMSMLNSAGAPVNVQLQMVMSDAATNQPVLTAQSSIFQLPAGVKFISVNDVAPVTYTTAPGGYSIDPSPNGFLPTGVFNICFTLTKWTSDLSEQIADECTTVEVEPLSPPQLVQPGDSDRISLRRPFFTWLPPAPFNAFSNLLYDCVLVEVQATQSASDAVQQNLPLLTQSNIAFTSFQYPLSLPELDTGKIYAWRVTAKNNSLAVANSEIWSFRIDRNEIDTTAIASTGSFARLHHQENAAFVLCKGILRFEYIHDNNTGEVDIKIFDISSSNRKPVVLNDDRHPVRFGQNLVQIDLQETTGMINNHMYLLELVNSRNDHWYLKFQYKKE
jgi:hypothetical protein